MREIFHNKEVIIVNDKVKYFLEGFTLGAKPVVKNIEVNNVNNQQLYVTENGTYTPDEGYTGFDSVEVDVPQSGGSGTDIRNEDITVTQNGVYRASPGYSGLGTVVVKVESVDPPPEPDPFPNMAVNAFQYTVALKAFVLESKLLRAASETKTFVLTSNLFRVEEVV